MLNRYGCLLVAALLGGCPENNLEDNYLTGRGTVPAGEECANGGVFVKTGADLDGNGVLVPTEVFVRTVICNEQEPAACVGRQFAVGPGGECPLGGWVFEVGLDNNRDGLLDDEEVAKAAQTCKGA